MKIIKGLISALLLLLFLPIVSYGQSGIVTKGLIGEQDIKHYDGVYSTFTRPFSTGPLVVVGGTGSGVESGDVVGPSSSHDGYSICFDGTTGKFIKECGTQLVIGSNVQAYDADLAYLAGFTPTANVKSILNAADYAAIKVLLALTIGTNVQAWDADLDYLAGFTPTANVKSILTAADYAAIKVLLSLGNVTNESKATMFTSPTFTGKTTTAASAAVAGAGFNLPHGVAPNTPANGDCWTTTSGLYCYINGATVGPYAIASTQAFLHIDDILTALGIASEATHFGSFTGSTIPDSSTAKAALQALETALELKATGPSSATSGYSVCFDGTTGKLLKECVGASILAALAAGGSNNSVYGISNAGVYGYYTNFTPVLVAAPAVDNTFSGTITTLVAGETLLQWDIVYCKNKAGVSACYKYDANGADKAEPPRGVATAGITADASGVFCIGDCIVRHDSWTAGQAGATNTDEGKRVYASNTPGEITITEPSTDGVVVGTLIEEKVVWFKFKNDGASTGYGAPVKQNSPTLLGKLTTAASATGGAGFNLPAGTAPSSPVDGDIWTTTAGLYARINSGTVGPFATAGGSPALDDITDPDAAKTFTLLDNNASALSFGATDKADILKIITTNAGEGVTMSGTLGVTGAITGNASTATALAANGANCNAGNYPLGVDASGAVESCTAAPTAASLHVDDILTALGIASEATHFGTFTGTTIADSSSAKVALQALETAVELKSPLASPTFTGTVTIPTPFTLGAVSVTATGTSINKIDDCLTTEMLVGGGAATAPVCTTVTGTGAPVLATTPTLVTPVIGAATGTSLMATGRVDGTVGMLISTAASPTTIVVATHGNASYFMNIGNSAANSIFTLPTAAAGLQYCAKNYTGITTVLKFQTSAAGQYIDLDGVNTATGGLIKSAGAAGDGACVVGVDATHWVAFPHSGTWTKD